MSKYPGMRPREGQVFRLWLRIHESDYDLITYNVRVGNGRDPGPQFSPNVRSNAIQASQQRLDAVLWKDGAPTLVEVKDFAMTSAIGQLLEYSALWAATYPAEKPARLLIVCNTYEYGFADRAAAANIAVSIAPTQ